MNKLKKKDMVDMRAERRDAWAKDGEDDDRVVVHVG